MGTFLALIIAAGAVGAAYYLLRYGSFSAGPLARFPSVSFAVPDIFSPLLAESQPGSSGAPVSAGKIPLSEAVRRLATAIARFETGYRGAGFPLDTSLWPKRRDGSEQRAAKNNNPGNLRFASQRGTVGKDSGGYAVFSSVQAGWDALLREVRNDMTQPAAFPGDAPGPTGTLAEFISAYAPASENPTATYIAFVSGELGVSPQARFVDWVVL